MNNYPFLSHTFTLRRLSLWALIKDISRVLSLGKRSDKAALMRKLREVFRKSANY